MVNCMRTAVRQRVIMNTYGDEVGAGESEG